MQLNLFSYVLDDSWFNEKKIKIVNIKLESFLRILRRA